ncbi:MAG: hypothetical protein U1E65_06810 [Myxococcota bacterium]
MKMFTGLTAGASLAAFMALSTPAKAAQLTQHESLDQGYAHNRVDDQKKDDKKKKKDGDKDKKGGKDGSCGADKKGKDGEKSCGQGSCG